MQRLAALVPRARLHLIRFHGVLAPNASLRGAILPGPAQDTRVPSGEHAQGAPARMGWARLLKRGFDLVMLTSDLNCMIAGARKQLDDLKSATN